MKNRITGILVLTLFLVAGAVWAATHRSSNLLNGSTLILYNGTADTATTFSHDDAWATNRTYVNALGDTIVPYATNISGAIAPEFAVQVPVWAKTDGSTAAASISASITANAAYTNNSVALTFHRSIDGGTTYDEDANSIFAYTITTAGGTTAVMSTNLPAAFLQGASHIRLWKVALGANETDAAIVTVGRVKLGGFAP